MLLTDLTMEVNPLNVALQRIVNALSNATDTEDVKLLESAAFGFDEWMLNPNSAKPTADQLPSARVFENTQILSVENNHGVILYNFPSVVIYFIYYCGFREQDIDELVQFQKLRNDHVRACLDFIKLKGSGNTKGIEPEFFWKYVEDSRFTLEHDATLLVGGGREMTVKHPFSVTKVELFLQVQNQATVDYDEE